MVSVPFSERRHRLNRIEVNPVKVSVREKLIRLIDEREDLLTASILFRVYYRLETYCKNRPDYPPHNNWEDLESYFGTEKTETPRAIGLDTCVRLGGS